MLLTKSMEKTDSNDIFWSPLTWRRSGQVPTWGRIYSKLFMSTLSLAVALSLSEWNTMRRTSSQSSNSITSSFPRMSCFMMITNVPFFLTFSGSSLNSMCPSLKLPRLLPPLKIWKFLSINWESILQARSMGEDQELNLWNKTWAAKINPNNNNSNNSMLILRLNSPSFYSINSNCLRTCFSKPLMNRNRSFVSQVRKCAVLQTMQSHLTSSTFAFTISSSTTRPSSMR